MKGFALSWRALGAAAVAAALAFGASANAKDVTATVKVFNYSAYTVTVSGKPVKFRDPDPFTFSAAAAPAKGQQTIKNYQYTLSKNGPAGNDILLQLDVNIGSTAKKCLTVMTYARSEVVPYPGEILVVGADNPDYSCTGQGNPKIEFNHSQNDLEIVIDRAGASWRK